MTKTGRKKVLNERMYPLKVHLNPNVIKGSIKENCSSNSLCINPTMTTTEYAITPKIFIYIHTRGVGAKEKKYFSASVFWLMEWLPGPK